MSKRLPLPCAGNQSEDREGDSHRNSQTPRVLCYRIGFGNVTTRSVYFMLFAGRFGVRLRKIGLRKASGSMISRRSLYPRS